MIYASVFIHNSGGGGGGEYRKRINPYDSNSNNVTKKVLRKKYA